MVVEVDGAWRRTDGYLREWRQITAVPHGETVIDREKFAALFPKAALPEDQIVHGFPFMQISGEPVFSIGPLGWNACIPTDPSRDVSYFWLFKRGGQFAYREPVWEADPLSVTQGHTRAHSLAIMSLATVFFLKRLFTQGCFPKDDSWTIQLDLEGMHQRGVLFGAGEMELRRDVEQIPRVSSDARISGRVTATAEAVREDPIKVGLDLLAETTFFLDPQKATMKELRKQLPKYLKEDDGSFPRLQFLKGLL